MKLYFWVTIIALVGCKASSDNSSAEQYTEIESMKLFEVGDETVTTDEFAYVYRKNNVNNDSAFTKSDIQEYLDLYIKFKLKIAEAKSRGMDTTAAFEREFNTYRDQLKKPYLTENKVTEQLIKEAYDRYKKEIKASHILKRIDPDAAPEDTLKAYNEILKIREQAIAGADFGALAKEHSEDPSAKQNNGLLGYFTSFQMVYPFESAAYKTGQGEVSMPVRTRFGYHIIKVHDKRPSHGKIEVSHIMLRNKPNNVDSTELRNKIFEIYDQAVGGVNWDDLARQFSDDINSKNTGGRLKPFTVGQMPYEFQEAAFALTAEGQISDPIKTPYGWHIIKLEKKYPLESFQEMEADIKSKINRDSRADLNRKALISRLKNENAYNESDDMSKVWSYADSTLMKGKWSYSPNLEFLQSTLFTIGSRNYLVKDFFEYLKANQKPNSMMPAAYMKSEYNNFVDERIITYEENHLEDKYVDYKMLVREYKEGILLFELMEKQVWNKAVEDTAGLRKFYEDHTNKYQWQKRVDAVVFNAANDSIIGQIKNMLNEKMDIDVDSLERAFNDQSSLALQVTKGKFESGENAIVDEAGKAAGVYEIENGGRHNLVWIKEVIPAGTKELSEIRGLVISDYQNHLEKLWIEELRQKYTTNINESALKYIYEKLEN